MTKGKPVGVYSLEKQEYILFEENPDFVSNLKAKIGEKPGGFEPWKVLLTDPEKDAKLQTYFTNLNGMGTFGAGLAKAYMLKSKEIGQGLVADGVAHNKNDVNATLTNGFYHLYGPVNDFVN